MGSDHPSAAEVAKALGGIDFPADRSKLVQHARNNDATERVMEFLERIPDKEYTQATEVEHELSEHLSGGKSETS